MGLKLREIWTDPTFLAAIEKMPANGAAPAALEAEDAAFAKNGPALASDMPSPAEFHGVSELPDLGTVRMAAPPTAAAPPPGGEAIERGGVCEVPAEDESKPPVCEMSESDKAELEESIKQSAAIQRAHDLGFQAGHAGKNPDPRQINDWPEAMQKGPGGAVFPTALYSKLLESYVTGFKEGKAERASDAVARKLNLTANHFADDRGRQVLKMATEAYEKGFADGQAGESAKPPKVEPMQPGQGEVLEAYNLGYKTAKEETPKAYNYGFEDGVGGGQQSQRSKVEVDGPEAPRMVATYERGFREGQAALMRSANDGYTDGQKDTMSWTAPPDRKQMSALLQTHLSAKKELMKSPWSRQLMDGYIGGYVSAVKGYGEKLAEATRNSRNQPQMDPAGKAPTPAEIERQRKWEEFDKQLQEMLDEWYDELRHHPIE